MHLVPAFLALIALAIARRWAWPSGMLFPVPGVGYLLPAGGRVHRNAALIIAGPLWLVGGRFLASW